VGAQSKPDSAASQELYERLASLDGAMFDAYNARDTEKVGTFCTEDLEFYHEKGGLGGRRKKPDKNGDAAPIAASPSLF